MGDYVEKTTCTNKFSGRTWVVATIKEQQYTKSSADIYIHNVTSDQLIFFSLADPALKQVFFQPPVNYDHVTTNGMVPSIHVVGDMMRSVMILFSYQLILTEIFFSFSARSLTS